MFSSILFLEQICQRIHRRIVTNIKNYRSHPQAVAIAHFNNDHRFDFVIVNAGLDTIDIYLGQNNNTFEYHTTYSTGSHSRPRSVAVGNFDLERGIDIAVANFDTNSIVIFMGEGDGSFIFNQSFSTGSSRPLMIAVADLNNDHRLDIAVLNYGTNSVGIFFGSKDGSFVFSTVYPTGYDSLPMSLVIAHLNNDDQLDIVVANFGTDNIGLFFGTGNGTFADQKIHSTNFGSNPTSVTAGDINHDNYLDIIVANSGAKNISLFFGDETGNFTRYVTYSTGSDSHPEFVGVYDLNGDNQLDIIALDSVNEQVYVLPGNENGTFPLLSMYLTESGSRPVSIGSADFNSDHKSDLLVVNRDGNHVLLLMEYDVQLSGIYSTFSAKTFYQPSTIAIADLNGDHLLDMVVDDASYDAINVFLGYGNGSFLPFSVMSIGLGVVTSGIQLADFNNDHQLDIVGVNPGDDSFNILFGYGDGTFSAANKYSTETVLYPHDYIISDVNHDDCLDLVFLSFTSDKIGICLGYCNTTFEMTSIYTDQTGWRPYGIVAGDFNNDDHADFVITYGSSNAIGLYFGDGHGQFSTPRTYSTNDGVPWYVITSDDFNNDNHTDLAGSGYATNKITILLGDGNGNFISERTYLIGSCYDFRKIVVGDFNTDSYLDFALGCSYSSQIVIVFGNKNGEFLSQTTYSTGKTSYPVPLASADFNNDNRLDIAIADSSIHSIGIWTNYYQADFAIQTKYSTGSSPQPYSVAIADFNNDTLLDLVVANSGMKNIGIRLGFGNGSFGMETIYSVDLNSFPRHVNVADLNQDGHADFVVADSNNDNVIVFFGNGDGTFGSHSTYSMGLQSSPTWVAIANMNNDGWVDLIVANHGTDRLGILYGYDYATFTLHQTYSTGNNSYLKFVSVADMNNDNRLDIVVVNRNADNIGIFFGDGNGSFPTQITYSTGTQSFPSAMTINDLNKDSYSDIIVGNDGTDSIGIILADGKGAFRPMITYPIGPYSTPSFIIVGDVNNDDELDVIVADETENNVGIFLGLGNGSLSVITTYFTGFYSRPCSIALADFNNDSYLDMVVAHLGMDTIGVSQGYGDGNFAPETTFWFRRATQPKFVAVGDFNDDDQLDIAVTNNGFGDVIILFGFGNGSFYNADVTQHYIRTLGMPSYLVVDDFNDDNRSDIAVICAENSAFTILFGTTDDDFVQGRLYTTSSGSPNKAMASGDFNNDSRLDLVVTNIEDGNIDIFLRNGNEFFGTPFIRTTGSSSQPYSVAIADFDRSNQSDIVMANYGTDNIGFISEELIKMPIDPTTYSTGIDSHPRALAVADFNNDDQIDIAIVNSGSNDVTIFRGFRNGSFEVIESYSTGIGSIPYSIAVNDFNNDHRLDLAIANAGANTVLILFGYGNGSFGNETTYSMGYDSRPYSVAVGDFDRDGWMDMAVANFGVDYVEILLQPC